MNRCALCGSTSLCSSTHQGSACSLCLMILVRDACILLFDTCNFGFILPQISFLLWLIFMSPFCEIYLFTIISFLHTHRSWHTQTPVHLQFAVPRSCKSKCILTDLCSSWPGRFPVTKTSSSELNWCLPDSLRKCWPLNTRGVRWYIVGYFFSLYMKVSGPHCEKGTNVLELID